MTRLIDRRVPRPTQQGRSTTSRVLFPAFLVSFFLIWTVRATVLFSVDQQVHDEVLRRIYANGVKFALWVLPAIAYLASVDQVAPLAYLKLTTRLTTRMWRYILLAGLIFGGAELVSAALLGQDLRPLRTAGFRTWIAGLAAISFSPICEEILFRGFVLGKLRAAYPFWGANMLAAVLFSATHWPNWLWTDGFQPRLLVLACTTWALGAALGWLVKRSGSLWPAIVGHIANNLVLHVLRQL